MSEAISNAGLLGLYERMALVRRAEERLGLMFADGEIPGFLHLSIGQEAVPVGVCATLEAADIVATPLADIAGRTKPIDMGMLGLARVLAQ